MRSLPPAARVYIGAIVAVGASLVVWLGPKSTFDSPFLFAVLLLASALTSAFKVSLPLARSGSTMSVSYAVDFAALLLLGPNETMIVAVISAWSQCTFRMKVKNPVYRTLFSMACLAITVQAAGFAYELLGGVAGTLGHDVPGLAKPLVAAATMYFVFNTKEHIRVLTRHFDDLVRAAVVQANETPRMLAALRDEVTKAEKR